MMLYICTKLAKKNSSKGFKGIERTQKNTKGHNSVKNIGEVVVLIPYTSSDST